MRGMTDTILQANRELNWRGRQGWIMGRRWELGLKSGSKPKLVFVAISECGCRG